MMEAISGWILSIENTGLAEAIREDEVLFPLIETAHVLAICLVVGSISIVDLRLLGFSSAGRPVSRLTQSVLPLTWGAFALAVATGSLLFMSHASKYSENGFFLAKLLLIAAAGLNMAVFHFITAKDAAQWENDAPPPLSARFAGGISLLLWVSVVACGRWIGFTMPVG